MPHIHILLILKATLERTRAKGKGRAIEVPAVLEWAPAKGIMRAWIIPAVSVQEAVEDSLHVKKNQATLERTRAKGKGRAIEVPAVLEWAPAKGIMRAWIIPAVLSVLSVIRAVKEPGHVKINQATLERTRAKGKGRAIKVPAVLEWAPAKGIMRARIIPAVSVLRAVKEPGHVKINQATLERTRAKGYRRAF
eukprot:scaffold1236_cov138-Skeletonema_marinoi.AAC.15